MADTRPDGIDRSAVDAAADGPQCAAVGCGEAVPAGRHWCRRHWMLLPKRLQNRLYHARGGELTRTLDEARAALETAEFGPRLPL